MREDYAWKGLDPSDEGMACNQFPLSVSDFRDNKTGRVSIINTLYMLPNYTIPQRNPTIPCTCSVTLPHHNAVYTQQSFINAAEKHTSIS